MDMPHLAGPPRRHQLAKGQTTQRKTTNCVPSLLDERRNQSASASLLICTNCVAFPSVTVHELKGMAYGDERIVLFGKALRPEIRIARARPRLEQRNLLHRTLGRTHVSARSSAANGMQRTFVLSSMLGVKVQIT